MIQVGIYSGANRRRSTSRAQMSFSSYQGHGGHDIGKTYLCNSYARPTIACLFTFYAHRLLDVEELIYGITILHSAVHVDKESGDLLPH